MTIPPYAPVVDDLVAQLEPVLRQHAATAEADRRLTPEAMAALIDAGVMRSLLPKSLGGLELDYLSALKLFEELSRIDSAAGWVGLIAAGIPIFAGLLPSAAAEEMLADPRVVCVGAWFPPGTAEPVQGGYRVTGQWAFGSGSNYATWFTGQALLTDQGVPRLGPDGHPLALIVFFRLRRRKSLTTGTRWGCAASAATITACTTSSSLPTAPGRWDPGRCSTPPSPGRCTSWVRG
jgi:alkylation response protein AidB-like acyl-CoA dehydrogenase